MMSGRRVRRRVMVRAAMLAHLGVSVMLKIGVGARTLNYGHGCDGGCRCDLASPPRNRLGRVLRPICHHMIPNEPQLFA